MADEPTLTMEEFLRDWITPRDALDLLEPSLGKEIAAASIMSRAANGLFVAVARTYVMSEYQKEDMRADLVAVPAVFLSEDILKSDHAFWNVGDFASYGPFGGGVKTRCFGVRFQPNGIREMLPTNKALLVEPYDGSRAPPTTPAANPGGRPSKPFWEPLLVEIARQLYVGDLKPQTQADIERAMHDWLTQNSHEAGETPVRDRARAVFKAIR